MIDKTILSTNWFHHYNCTYIPLCMNKPIIYDKNSCLFIGKQVSISTCTNTRLLQSNYNSTQNIAYSSWGTHLWLIKPQSEVKASMSDQMVALTFPKYITAVSG